MSSMGVTIEERQPLRLQHQTNLSASSSVNIVPRKGSIGHGRPLPRAAAPPTSQNNPYVSNAPSNFSKPVSSPESRRRPSHNRSTSIGGIQDGVGNLNRWSQSTTSSKSSGAHARSNSTSRRMSFGGAGFSFGLPSSQTPPLEQTQSPNKLQKNRPSADSSPRKRSIPRREGEHSNSSSTSTLPPLITLPSFQYKPIDGASPLSGATSTPTTAAILSAAVRTAVPDYFGKTWEDTVPDAPAEKQAQAAAIVSAAVRSAVPNYFGKAWEETIPHSPADSKEVAATLSPNTFSPSEESAKSSRLPRAERSQSRGHSRNRSQAGKTSSGTTSSEKSRDRGSKPPSQKAMLSKALQKANTAVLLDNAQNFEGAMQAYSEACNLLQQVMLRSSGDEDRRKLEAIRNTYTSRIEELEKIAPHLTDEGKALPKRPESNDFKSDELGSPIDDEEPILGTATVTRIINDDSYVPESRPGQIPASQVPRRRDSLQPSAFDTLPHKISRNLVDQYASSRTFSKSPMREVVKETTIRLAPPMESQYMPPPLSPRRPLSPPARSESVTVEPRQVHNVVGTSNISPDKAHRRAASNESMSWLDTIDESGGSTTSSVHSRTSSLNVRRKHIRGASGATEAEFDAALDAAVEAAYDDGFEPVDDSDLDRIPIRDFDAYDDSLVANVRRRVELAKERVRQTERETAIELARDRERQRQQQLKEERDLSLEYDDNESEEEERMLEEMTRDYVMDDFEFGLQSKSALPRESDSSGFSGRTWNSSIASNPATGGSSLSMVAETSILPEMPPLQSKAPGLMHPPPAQALPPPPVPSIPLSPLLSSGALGVRSRRLSGQNAKQLKIETTPRIPPTAPLPQPVSAVREQATDPITIPSGVHGLPRTGPMGRPAIPHPRQASSPFPRPSPADMMSPPTPSLIHTPTNDEDNSVPRSGSPGRAVSRNGLRKNFSSSSLKNLKSRNLSVSNTDDVSDASPLTPMSSNQFGTSAASREAGGRIPTMPTLPTPIAAAFREKMNGVTTTGGMYLFNSDIRSPESPGSPGALGGDAPIPLEPCPTEFLLRPFWLMRALYQTIAHPRGGYLSTKLFVPRDVWRVKGVKIKGVEEKIACCDFLTAALQKLAKVDTCDADSVLEEMQSLENVLEQVQNTLTRRFGNEVGTQSSAALFKDASGVGDPESATSGSKTPSSKSSFSWRRLRSKNSGVGLANTYTSKTPTGDSVKEGLTMSTLPMTTLTSIRFAKRDVTQVQFSGPNANYMCSLAKLFDAAQVIDQVARQVEDPGLKHTDKTQVGLELSTRHAAEFFGFYICRFVLTDISLLLDKFIKRGSEWVLV